jgi:hypothetical protein
LSNFAASQNFGSGLGQKFTFETLEKVQMKTGKYFAWREKRSHNSLSSKETYYQEFFPLHLQPSYSGGGAAR